MQIIHQQSQGPDASAVLGALSTLNPMHKATTAKRSAKTLSFLKSFIFSHLLPTFKFLLYILSLGFGRGEQ
jgi:hypothetical protein